MGRAAIFWLQVHLLEPFPFHKRLAIQRLKSFAKLSKNWNTKGLFYKTFYRCKYWCYASTLECLLLPDTSTLTKICRQGLSQPVEWNPARDYNGSDLAAMPNSVAYYIINIIMAL